MKEDNQAVIKALNMYGRVPEMWELLEEIERLNKENEELKKIQCTFLGTGCKAEIERLNNIINELEKWLEVNLTNLEKEKANNTYDKGLKQGMLSNGRLIKNKLQELKGDNKSER